MFTVFETRTPKEVLAWGNYSEYGTIFWLIIPEGGNTIKQKDTENTLFCVQLLFVCAGDSQKF